MVVTLQNQYSKSLVGFAIYMEIPTGLVKYPPKNIKDRCLE